MDAAPVRGSMRETTPVSISCSLLVNSSYIMPRSASRMPWMMTCLAAWAAMRPNFFVSTGMATVSPTL